MVIVRKSLLDGTRGSQLRMGQYTFVRNLTSNFEFGSSHGRLRPLSPLSCCWAVAVSRSFQSARDLEGKQPVH